MTPADILPMTPLQSQALLWTLIGGAYLFVHGLATMGSRRSRAEDRLADAIMAARHPRVTKMRTTCAMCRITQEREVPYRADLGAVCEAFRTCLACRLERRQGIEIDLDRMTVEDIRRELDDHESAPNVSAPRPAAPIRLGEGEAHPANAE